MTAWKAHERRLAKRFNGHRNGNRGAAAADVDAGWCVIEAKERKTLPAWLEAAMRQAESAASGEQLPLTILHEKGQRSDKDLVILRLDKFLEYFGEIETNNADTETTDDNDRC